MTRICSAVFSKASGSGCAKAAETNIERDDDIADFMTLYFLCAGRRLDPDIARNERQRHRNKPPMSFRATNRRALVGQLTLLLTAEIPFRPRARRLDTALARVVA